MNTHTATQSCQVKTQRHALRPVRPNSGCARCGTPRRQGARSHLTHVPAFGEMRLRIEGVVNGGMGGEKSLGGLLGFEPLLLSFSSADGKMRVFGAVVISKSARSVKALKTHFAQCRGV
mgnify:CR=1 FL=1